VANVVRTTVENAGELLNAAMYGAGAVVRLQSAAAEAGPFANEATAALVSGTRVYTLYDADGTSTTWYRVRYEDAGGTTTSDWSAPFQVGDEQAGLICSLYDVEQRTGTVSDNEREMLIELIRDVTVEIERYTGRDFTGARSDVTFRLHTRAGRTLWIPRGIQSVTTLKVATEDQPTSGGTYTTATATDYYLDPPEYERAPGWPATRIVFRSNPTGPIGAFYRAAFGAEITGRPGFAEVPGDVQRVGAEMVLSAFLTKGSGEAERAVVGPSGQPVILRDPRHRAVLDGYRTPVAG